LLFQIVDNIEHSPFFVAIFFSEHKLKWSTIQKEALWHLFVVMSRFIDSGYEIHSTTCDRQNLLLLPKDSNPMICPLYGCRLSNLLLEHSLRVLKKM
jgi:hypothetical protein